MISAIFVVNFCKIRPQNVPNPTLLHQSYTNPTLVILSDNQDVKSASVGCVGFFDQKNFFFA